MLIDGDPFLVIEERSGKRIAARIHAVGVHDGGLAPGAATVGGLADRDAAGTVQAAEHQVGIVHGVVGTERDGGIARRIHVGQQIRCTSLVGQMRQLNIEPTAPAVERGVRPARAVIAPFTGIENSIVVGAGHQIARIGEVDGDGGFILRAVAAQLGTGLHELIVIDLIDIGARLLIRIQFPDIGLT